MVRRVAPRQKRKPPARKPPKPRMWLDWTSASFREAERDDKPVLLNLTASWSHSCRRFDQDVLSDTTVGRIIAESYVPIRVDADRRPDVAERYNFGGYPTLAVLTPKGEILGGGTAVDAARLTNLLRDASQRYKHDKATITTRAAQAQRLLDESAKRVALMEGEFSEDIIWNVAETLLGSFDADYGGFGKGAKFPQPDALDFSLLLYNETGHRGYMLIASKTLESMMRSPLFDAAEGGFHGYSDNREWTAPFYEKMLDVNVGTLRNAVHLFQITRRPEYRDICSSIMRFLDQTLLDNESGLYRGSQYGDVEYFKLDGALRPQSRHPPVDSASYTQWNCMTVTALAEASQVFSDRTLLDRAVKVMDTLRARMFQAHTGFSHFYSEGKPWVGGLLTDQAYALEAYVTLSQVTMQPTYLQHALEMVEIIKNRFIDGETGACFDVAADPTAIGYLQRREKSLIENAVVARSLNQLSRLSGNGGLHDAASRILKAFSAVYPRRDLMSAEYASAVYLHLRPVVEVAVVGGSSDPKCAAFVHAAFNVFEPRRVVKAYDPAAEATRIAELGYETPTQPVAYISVGDVRSHAVEDSAKLPTVLVEYAGGKATP